MNERIKELAEQAKFAMNVSNDPNSPPSWWGAGHNDTFEKFAELIVRECVKVCADRGTHHDGLYSAWAVDCSKRIEKHFGVE
jgi:hypothetical protein